MEPTPEKSKKRPPESQPVADPSLSISRPKASQYGKRARCEQFWNHGKQSSSKNPAAERNASNPPVPHAALPTFKGTGIVSLLQIKASASKTSQNGPQGTMVRSVRDAYILKNESGIPFTQSLNRK